MSTKLIPIARCRICTSPGPGGGSSRSSTRSASGPPAGRNGLSGPSGSPWLTRGRAGEYRLRAVARKSHEFARAPRENPPMAIDWDDLRHFWRWPAPAAFRARRGGSGSPYDRGAARGRARGGAGRAAVRPAGARLAADARGRAAGRGCGARRGRDLARRAAGARRGRRGRNGAGLGAAGAGQPLPRASPRPLARRPSEHRARADRRAPAASLGRREADVAIRLSRPTDGAIVARRLAVLPMGSTRARATPPRPHRPTAPPRL